MAEENARQDQASRGSRSELTTIVRDYLPAIGTLGLVLYGLLRLAYMFFYVRLRTTPEEVGYDYVRVLSESIAGAVELILFCAVLFALVAVLYYVVRLLPLIHHPSRRHVLRRAVSVMPRALGRRVVLRSLAASTAFVFGSLPILAWWQGGLAQGGQTIRNVYFVGVPYLPVLAVQAVPADVTWIDKDTEKILPFRDRKCLMYLGQANGVSVFYDVQSRESMRIPTSDIVISLRFTFFVPDECR